MQGNPIEPAFAVWLSRTRSGFVYNETDGVPYWTIEAFTRTGLVRHGFTTRMGGVSQGAYASLNLSFDRTHSVEETKRNYVLAAGALGMRMEDCVIVNGDHGTVSKHVARAHAGDGFLRAYAPDEMTFDGHVTDTPGLGLVAIHADCTPVYALDTVHRAIGLCHAGWRGTVNGMVTSLIESMQTRFGSDPAQLLCAIGPNIGQCCFEVHDDVARQFEEKLPGFGGVAQAEQAGKSRVHLAHAAAFQLYRAGVQPAHTTLAHLCTCCNARLFHSYRRDGKWGGSMASFLQLIPPQEHTPAGQTDGAR